METHGVKYIGSKRSLIPYILECVKDLPVGTMLDPFTGTTRVAQAFRKKGWKVCASDLSWASEAYAWLFLKTTSEDLEELQALVNSLGQLEGSSDWITQNYCDVVTPTGGVVRVWKPKNGMRADAIRNKIEEWDISYPMKMRLIAILILGMDAVDNTVGVQQAYLKDWAARTENNLRLTIPNGITEGPVGDFLLGSSLTLEYPEADIAYVDTPYSSHCYATYYHIWDSITKWDKPEVGLNTNRRKDRIATSFDESMKSPWNSKKTAYAAFECLFDRLPVKFILVSYSDESLLSLSDLEPLLRKYKNYEVTEIDYKRNIMSKIGNATLYDKDRKQSNVEYIIRIEK